MTSSASSLTKALSALLVAVLFASLVGCAGLTRVREPDETVAETAPDTTRPASDTPAPEVLDHVIAASVHEAEGDYLHALHEYNRALLRDSTYAELYHAAAEMHQKLGELESAILLLESGVRKCDDPTLLTHLGELQLLDKRNDEAVATFERLMGRKPASVTALKHLATAYERSGRKKDALAVYDSLLARNQVEPDEVLMRKVSLLSSLGEYEQAIEVYRRLRQHRPQEDRIPFFIGGLYLDMGDTTKAAESIAAATNMRPVEPRYWNLRIRLEVARGHDERAADLADSALSFNPEDVELHALAANVFLRNELAGRAERTLRRTIELDPDEPAHYINLGFLLHERGEFGEAERLYEDALKLEPGDPQLLNNYAYLLAEKGERLDEALEFVDDAVSIEPDNASYLDTKGWILYRLERYDDARTYLERAVELSPDHPELLDHLGDLYHALGEQEKAREMWRRALEHGGPETSLSEKLGE
ncbi:MAG: Beta-barrel assembly-enhancing protease [Calditrichaeota bacterium]|nr:Beta-barrel assembly-enhancing protease [Calditrichota bacterium]